jgi:creatinine amidohydrolase/Fe(II)-dependent formamide hydrolase-like protein
MLLALSTWPEIETYLSRSRTVVVPIGSNEQHGPTGLLGTDWLCPEIIAHRAHDAGDLLIAPTFAVGMAQHHLGFPGSISLRPSTMIAAIRDWAVSLHGHGFEQLYFLNGHGGNIATIEAAFSEIYSEASYLRQTRGFALKLRNWWELPGVMRRCATQFAYPDAIKSANYATRIAPTGPIREAADFRARYPDGRMGSDPAQASPEKGAEIVALAVQGLIEEVKAFGSEAAV